MSEKLSWVVRNAETGEVDERQTELLRQQDAEIRAEVEPGTSVPTYPQITPEQLNTYLRLSGEDGGLSWGTVNVTVTHINAEIRRQYDEARAAFWKDDKSLDTAKERFDDAHNLPENAL